MPWHTSLLSTYQPFSMTTDNCIDNNDIVLHDTYTDHNNNMYIIIDVRTSRPTRAQLYYTIVSGDFNGDLFTPTNPFEIPTIDRWRKKLSSFPRDFFQYNWLNQTITRIMLDYYKTINTFQKRYLFRSFESKNNKKYNFP